MITFIGKNRTMIVKTHVTVVFQPSAPERSVPIVDAQGNLWRLTPNGIERVG